MTRISTLLDIMFNAFFRKEETVLLELQFNWNRLFYPKCCTVTDFSCFNLRFHRLTIPTSCHESIIQDLLTSAPELFKMSVS